MKNIILLIFLIACGCHKVESNRSENLITENIVEIDSTESSFAVLFKDVPFEDNLELQPFQQYFLSNLIENGDGEFETDTSYQVDNVRKYKIENDFIAFYIKGHFIPSSVDFHFYGGQSKVDTLYEIYHLPVQTYFGFTKYQLLNTRLYVYGQLGDQNSEDTGEELLFILSK